MEFLTGLSLCLLLVTVSVMVRLITKLLPNELALLPLVIMLVVDATLAFTWLEIFGDGVRKGIAVAFVLVTVFRALYFILTDESIRRRL